MKKTTKKSPSKASHKKAVRNLDVKPTKTGKVRGGATADGTASFDVFTYTKSIDKATIK